MAAAFWPDIGWRAKWIRLCFLCISIKHEMEERQMLRWIVCQRNCGGGVDTQQASIEMSHWRSEAYCGFSKTQHRLSLTKASFLAIMSFLCCSPHTHWFEWYFFNFQWFNGSMCVETTIFGSNDFFVFGSKICIFIFFTNKIVATIIVVFVVSTHTLTLMRSVRHACQWTYKQSFPCK